MLNSLEQEHLKDDAGSSKKSRRVVLYILVCIATILGTSFGSHLVSTLTADEVKQIDTSSVPQVVLDAAKAEKPDGTITGAEFENELGVDLYEITVTEGEIEYEIDISPAGEVLEVIVDDDSGDEAMLKLGYTLVVVSPVCGLSFAAYSYWMFKCRRGKERP